MPSGSAEARLDAKRRRSGRKYVRRHHSMVSWSRSCSKVGCSVVRCASASLTLDAVKSKEKCFDKLPIASLRASTLLKYAPIGITAN
eukprot:CAMPEP_0179188792 /NCGR_PEP_ID=MMETSP0796-20121207/93709_1 /TAXON_ID=73915 /ORGANISM="Pyrodinium bahamense, Strain pbaha01" /LENGTH=86 /DNA_ID=CAMNT_0020892907 /DNA_START=119 /DNA_END=379 /DNA_ORIENTATION=-